MKRLIAITAMIALWMTAAWADSPLTSTDFYRAYDAHPMVTLAGEVQVGDFIPTTLLNFLADEKSPIDVRLAVVNKLGWSIDGNDGVVQLGEYLMKRHKVKSLDKLYKKLDGKTLAVYAYSKAMQNYFQVNEAAQLGHEAVKKDKDHSLSVALIAALIDAQIYLDSDWSMVYKVVADVVHDGSLKLDMRQEAIDIIMEYIGLYKDS